MDIQLFLAFVLLLIWLMCQTICILLIMAECKCRHSHHRCPPCYGYHVAECGTNRVGTDKEPNFYGKD